MIKNLKQEKIFAQENQPTPECHASTVLLMDDGNVVSAWFGGTKEKAPDVKIWVSVKNKDGWSAPVYVSEEEDIACWNPVLFKKKDGTVCLFYKKGATIQHWITMVVYSKDNAKTWSAPKVLVDGDDSGGRGPVKNKILRLSNGDLLAPASSEQGVWTAFADRSVDDGDTWEKQQFIAVDKVMGEQVGMIQPTLWESAPGKVHMLLRTNQGYAYRSDSEDYGKTWCKAYKTDVPNNNSGLDVVKLDDGMLVLICNPVKKNWGPRTPLVLLGSKDNGKTWEEIVKLENDPDLDSEYSYPAIIKDGNTLYMTYTYNRKVVAFATAEIVSE